MSHPCMLREEIIDIFVRIDFIHIFELFAVSFKRFLSRSGECVEASGSIGWK